MGRRHQAHPAMRNTAAISKLATDICYISVFDILLLCVYSNTCLYRITERSDTPRRHRQDSPTMSTNTNPDPAATAPAFIPLEANPQLLTALIHKLGVSPALQMHDVYSLTEPELLSFIPRPALALLLVFPISAVYESHRMAEDSLASEYNGTGDKEPVLWWRQTIRNACGMMGLLHAVANGPAREFISMFCTAHL